MKAADPLFEPIPRWPGAPPICTYENLPAFDDLGQAQKYAEANCGSCSIYLKWTCPSCKKLHVAITPPAVSGGSSGNARAFTPYMPRPARLLLIPEIKTPPGLPSGVRNGPGPATSSLVR